MCVRTCGQHASHAYVLRPGTRAVKRQSDPPQITMQVTSLGCGAGEPGHDHIGNDEKMPRSGRTEGSQRHFSECGHLGRGERGRQRARNAITTGFTQHEKRVLAASWPPTLLTTLSISTWLVSRPSVKASILVLSLNALIGWSFPHFFVTSKTWDTKEDDKGEHGCVLGLPFWPRENPEQMQVMGVKRGRKQETRTGRDPHIPVPIHIRALDGRYLSSPGGRPVLRQGAVAGIPRISCQHVGLSSARWCQTRILNIAPGSVRGRRHCGRSSAGAPRCRR
jgi:hypothetical protein